jgi:D-alanyl-lipoteichoic acid acyltransferase DltB (MBOAT superfamily)
LSFNSFNYVLLFLPAIFIVSRLAHKLPIAKTPQICILLGSMVFYGWHNSLRLGFLLGSIVVNWQIGKWIGGSSGKRRKQFLQLGLALNIGFLSVFKYLDFLTKNISYLIHYKIPVLALASPLGISFFTLSQIMYLVDCYEELLPATNLFDHATFVSFFPYVIMGPICRAKRVLQQFPSLNGPAGPSTDTVARALYLFSLGLAKKVVFADSFARIADAGFDSAQAMSTVEAWSFLLSFTFQLYYDFSGYSDMAVASAWLMGIDIPQNFNSPYISKSITEFWQRWHISLSNFITNYLYTPILRAMGKATITTSVFAVLLAMAIAGLWHGPAWTFVIFGALHGCALAANQVWRRHKKKMPGWLGWLLTFLFVNITFVFFRSANVPSALRMLNAMLPHAHLAGVAALTSVFPITPYLLLRPVVIGSVLVFAFKTSQQLAESFRPSHVTAFAATALFLVCIFFMNSTPAKGFVYFAF